MNQEAGFWVRLGAGILDGLIVGIPLAIIFGGWDSEGTLKGLFMDLYILILPVIWGGYTIGKRICRIRIRKVSDHSSPGIGTMLLRNIVGGIVYALTLGIGVIVSVFMVSLREDKRALHDFIAGTEVIHD
ncbi:RDD family protein [Paenibacillus sp. CMAA1364]